MPRYFIVKEIDRYEFIKGTAEDLDCCQLAVSTSTGVYVAIDEVEEDEIQVPLELFEEE